VTLRRVWGLTFGRRVRKRKWRADAVADGSGRSCGLAGAVENARGGRFDRVATVDARFKNIRRSIRRSSLAAVSDGDARSSLPVVPKVRAAPTARPGPDGFANPWRHGCPRLFYPRPATASTANDDTRSRDVWVVRIQCKCCLFSFNRSAFAFRDR